MVFEVEVDCTASCTLIQHGSLLTKALTKRGICEESLIKFLCISCSNYAHNLDENVSNKKVKSDDINRFRLQLCIFRDEVVCTFAAPIQSLMLLNFSSDMERTLIKKI